MGHAYLKCLILWHQRHNRYWKPPGLSKETIFEVFSKSMNIKFTIVSLLNDLKGALRSYRAAPIELKLKEIDPLQMKRQSLKEKDRFEAYLHEFIGSFQDTFSIFICIILYIGASTLPRPPTSQFVEDIISYHIISYHIISYHIISYHIISYHIISYHIISYHIISYHIISYHIISYHIISYHIISYHIISYHIISYHIISYHIISYHIISYHIISYIYLK